MDPRRVLTPVGETLRKTIEQVRQRIVPETPEETLARKEREREHAFAARLASTGLAPLHIEETATLTPTPAQLAVLRHSSAPGSALVLVGPRGVGKTLAAAWIVRRRAQAETWSYFVNWPAFLERLREAARTKSDATVLERRLRMTSLAVIDDLGAEQATEWAEERLYLLLDYRLNHGLPIVVTTNRTPEELDALLSARCSSRLFGMVHRGGAFVPMVGRDLRRS